MNSTDLKMAYKPASISEGIAMVDTVINRNYLADSETHDVPELMREELPTAFGFIKITRIVADKEENFNEKLASVYSSLYTFFTSAEKNVDGAIVMLICGKRDKIDYYLGIRHNKQRNKALEILYSGLEGNFPGSKMELIKDSEEIETFIDKYIPKNDLQKKVTSVYAVPSLKTEKDEIFVQGIEKFIDTMADKEYTALFISTPISKPDLDKKKRGFENIYTELSKFSEINLNFGENESRSTADGTSMNFNATLGESTSDAVGHSYSTSESSGSSFQGFLGGTNSNTTGSSSSTSNTRTTSQNRSQSTGETTSKTITNTVGTSKSATFTLQVKTVQELMKKIDFQLERINKGEAYGLWESACYFIADKSEISIMAANTYRSLLVGEKTSTDSSVINYWEKNQKETKKLMGYLHNLIHPVFVEKVELQDKVKNFIYKYISASNMVNGQELPILMGLPQKSVSGVTSISFASFGRNVQNDSNHKDKRKINLGCIYHLGKELPETKVTLTANEFTKHCFVTGSTGSGKSNTVYKLLEEFINQNIKFLIIEPAKGEYKLAFGELPEINIFTTNAKYHKLLKINPFTFCDEIHVLEHLDRLIEIFSACWPLYAAMPAVLKESFEKAYERVGWDLQNSMYIGEGASEDKKKYPSFKTVCEILPEILENSKFSTENKGNYEGALVTRVNSLTNGIMGTIFSAESEIENEVLFDQNTIVDISRVGSSETKSLIMGILILKLNEYRMSKSEGTNLPLRHITVLEEAHNILKRTSTDQSQEGANLAGKSVEMISNSIAEMRTYGEGFIIVDQSPAMVAQSAITNTNTKIIMRLADYNDCETVGRSVSLNDEQIKEISRLNQGVAVIHQSSWTEAVLAKIDKNTAEDKYGQEKPVINDFSPLKKLRGNLIPAIFEQRNDDYYDLDALYSTIRNTPRISIETEDTFKEYIENIEEHSNNEDKFAEIIVNILDCKGMIGACVPEISPLSNGNFIKGVHNIQAERWLAQLKQSLTKYIDASNDIISACVFYILYWIYNQEDRAKRWKSNHFVASFAVLKLLLKNEVENKKIKL